MLNNLTKKLNKRSGAAYFVDSEGNVIFKECSKCSEVLELERFNRKKDGAGGRISVCKVCSESYQKRYREVNKDRLSEYGKAWRINNADRYIEQIRKWKEDNKEYCSAWQLDWQRRNKDKVAAQRHRRRARIQELPNKFTSEDMARILAVFNGGCALTGEKDGIQWDHVIPISAGVVGTVPANMIPLRADINKSKGEANIFEWFDINSDRLGLDKSLFDGMIQHIASINGMTPDEYRDFCFACFDK